MAQYIKIGLIDQLGAARSRLGHLLREIVAGLEALHRVQFDQPWKGGHRPMHGGR